MPRGRKGSIFVSLASLVVWSIAAPAALLGRVGAGIEAGDDRANATQVGPVHAGLEPGHPSDQALAPNETHKYEAKLSPGQYFRLAAEPQEVDVVVTISAPDGHLVLKKKSPYGAQGPVNACIVARSAGTYEIAVTATDNNARSGRYQIRIAELRKATSRDESRSKAEEAVADAQGLREKGTTESRRLAIDKYAEALPILTSTGDRLAEAQTLEQLGSLRNELGSNKKALVLLRQSLVRFRSLRDRRGEGMAMSDLGSLENDLGDNKRALVHLSQAIIIREEVGDRRGKAETLEYIGTVYENTSEFEKALEKYNAALSRHWSRLPGHRRGADGARIFRPGVTATTITSRSLGRGIDPQ